MRHLKLLLLLSACGRQIVEFPANSLGSKDAATAATANGPHYAPVATPITPLNDATDVAFTTVIVVGFSVPMDALTINETTFVVKQGAAFVPGSVTYDEASMTATFHPAHALDPNARYTATVTTGAQDASGRALANAPTWSFTTATDGAAPVVNATTPVDGASAVLAGDKPTATFSKTMDATTINFLTFTLAQGSTPIAGTVSLDSTTNMATFSPDVPLALNRLYTATITTGAKDTRNAPLAQAHVWTFATAVRPTVIVTRPLNNANNVSTSITPTATFDKPINGATITNVTFKLQKTVGLAAVTGVVTFDAATNTATFAPSGPLDLNTGYTATITTGVEDTQTVALGADYVWTFFTATCAAQAPVDLGFAAPFAVLAASSITNVVSVGTIVTGNLGLSPNDETSITGFPPGVLIGTQYADSPPDPVAGAAQASLTTAYLDAASRTSACRETVTPLDLGGRTLLPNLYFSSSTMAITGTLTLDGNGDANAVFIFQMAAGLTTASDSAIVLINGATARNVFWQVGTTATIGLRTDFHGTIMAQSAITLADGASIDGRALARTAAVTLDNNVVTKPQ